MKVIAYCSVWVEKEIERFSQKKKKIFVTKIFMNCMMKSCQYLKKNLILILLKAFVQKKQANICGKIKQ